MIHVDAALDQMQLFVKKDSIVPNRDVQQYIGEKPLTNLVLDTYLDKKAQISFYKDDTKSKNYQKVSSLLRNMAKVLLSNRTSL
ncbi:hypothetical protein [Metabacillus sp. RGM 3146]|uniref:hypothetical protein n=1 Tax=Metabacillus sp. RGM 3146 TaxID=3401092 RepID=UPI003B99EB73